MAVPGSARAATVQVTVGTATAIRSIDKFMKHPFGAKLKPDRHPCLNYRQILHILERITDYRYAFGQVQDTSSVTIGSA
jgi:hypothetical protein